VKTNDNDNPFFISSGAYSRNNGWRRNQDQSPTKRPMRSKFKTTTAAASTKQKRKENATRSSRKKCSDVRCWRIYLALLVPIQLLSLTVERLALPVRKYVFTNELLVLIVIAMSLRTVCARAVLDGTDKAVVCDQSVGSCFARTYPSRVPSCCIADNSD